MVTAPEKESTASSGMTAWQVAINSGSESAVGSVLDCTASGLAIRTAQPFPAGTQVELRFGLRPDAECILRLQGTVMYWAQGRLGVQFARVRLTDHPRVCETIRQLTSRDPD